MFESFKLFDLFSIKKIFTKIMNKTDGPFLCQLVNNFLFPIIFPFENIEFALSNKSEKTDKFLMTLVLNVTQLGFYRLFVFNE